MPVRPAMAQAVASPAAKPATGVSKTWGGVLACPGLIGLADA